MTFRKRVAKLDSNSWEQIGWRGWMVLDGEIGDTDPCIVVNIRFFQYCLSVSDLLCIFAIRKYIKMESVCNNFNEYERLIVLTEHLRDEKNLDEAITECSAAVKWAIDNNSLTKEMQALNLLASLYWSKNDLNEALAQYGKVAGIGREHDLRYSDEYVHSIYHAVVILTRIQPPPPAMFSLAEELVEVRGKMVDNDGNDKELQDYKMILETLNRVYKRKHRLRRQKEYVYTEIVGIG